MPIRGAVRLRGHRQPAGMEGGVPQRRPGVADGSRSIFLGLVRDERSGAIELASTISRASGRDPAPFAIFNTGWGMKLGMKLGRVSCPPFFGPHEMGEFVKKRKRIRVSIEF
jgi:hypothetical protein